MKMSKNFTVLAGTIISLLVLGPTVSGAPSAPSETEAHDRMTIWEGYWKSQIERKETPYSHAASVPAHFSCSWTADKGYMVCEYLTEKADPGEGRPADHLTIFTYDEKGQTYKHLGISKDYKTLEEVASIDGNVWHYNYEVAGQNGKTFNMRDTYQFVTPRKLITRIEISADGGQQWTLMSESVATKLK
jgi:hypothetical protein